jgi:leucyl-tRNA synthetase
VVAETFFREEADGGKTWFNPAEVDIQRDDRARVVGATLRADGKPVHIGGIEKMAKSKNNGVDPQAMVDRFGADTVRLFSMFAAPPEQSLEWNEAGVEGMSRFLKRLWTAAQKHAAGGAAEAVDPTALDRTQRDLRRKLHETIAKVGDDIGRRHAFNTAIAAVMELLNAIGRFDDASAQGRAVLQEAFEAISLMLNPIAPHTCHALWQALGHAETLLEDQRFPGADPAALEKDALTLAVQVNGKLRGTIEVAPHASRQDVEQAALADANVQRFLDGRAPTKVIVVPGKIVNIVIAGG